MKDSEIYPKFEFRLTHEEKAWLRRELKRLRQKFSEPGYPAVSQGELLVAALRHGVRYLHQRQRLKGARA